VERLREIERFASVEQLKQQLDRDRARALAVLAAGRPDPNRVTHA
jgi:FAD synthase